MVTHSSASRPGFTLMEVMLAMTISALMLGSINFLAQSNIKTTNALIEVQTEEITRDAFFQLMDRHFKTLPGNARMELTYQKVGQRYLSDMTFQDVPTSFSWGGQTISAEAIRISTRVAPDQTLDIVLSYFDEPILDTEESVAERGIEPIIEIELLKNVNLFEWTAAENNRLQFPMDWEDQNLIRWDWDRRDLPGQIQLMVRFGDSNQMTRRVFWVPRKVSPQQITRNQFRNQGGGGGNPTGGNPTGGNNGQQGGGNNGQQPSGGAGNQGNPQPPGNR